MQVANRAVTTDGGAGGESLRAPLQKGAAFGRMKIKKEMKKLKRKTKKEKKCIILVE